MEFFVLEGEFKKIDVHRWARKVLFFNPDLVYNENHLRFALWHTDKAFKNGANIARDLQMEFLIRLSGRKQIKRALEFLPQGRIGVCVVEGSIEDLVAQEGLKVTNGAPHADSCPNEDLRKVFGIEADGGEAEKAILEKIATLDV